MTRYSVCLLIVGVMLATTGPAAGRSPAVEASTVRGQVYRLIKDKQVPANGIAVRLNHAKKGPSSYSYSNSEGMYYLYNIPADQYTLEVTAGPKNILKFAIKVQDKQYTDIAPIKIN
jgi:hypothetical protein